MITLNTNTVHAIIARPNEDVQTFWVSKDSLHFFKFLLEGLNLSQATNLTQEQYPHFDLTGAIHFLLKKINSSK